MDKLYPPNIAGTLPSFYIPDEGTTKIVVPFSMNKTVSRKAIKGFSLRIKTANTDILYGVLTNYTWASEEISYPEVEFDVPQRILDKLIIGQFYKVQLAYIDQSNITGYYSTVGIIKYTAKPTLTISDFNFRITNMNKTEYIGVYNSEADPTEKAYQYSFNLYNSKNELIETSGWLIHNSYNDADLDQSIDYYILKHAMQTDVVYKLQYEVITNNNLRVKSPKYLVMNSKTIEPEIRATLEATLDYNNACVNLKLIGERNLAGNEYAITGSFLLTRASSADNFSTWLTISDFVLTGELPAAFLFRDYTIEQGVTYIYSLQQYNDYKIYSNRILTKEILAQFEDIFLFDGERQLRIKFNPKISSFKTTVQDTKKTTLGGKYPFIFRNGYTEYKEFPINGLISYMMDNDAFFVSLKDDFNIQNWVNTTDIVDENIHTERLFKLQVLNWLNDGKVKLFKSPQEGNYIVRLMNVSLTPIDSVSRMLHNFSCQATEIADFNFENLAKYKLINVEDVVAYSMRWETVVFRDLLEQYKTVDENGRITDFGKLYDIDLAKNEKVYHIKIDDAIQGLTFSFVDVSGVTREIMVGATGSYEAFFEDPVTKLKLVNKSNVQNYISNNHINNLQHGMLTFAIRSVMLNTFDTITNLRTGDIPIYQVFGPQENILSYYNNIKRQVSRIYYARFSKMELIEVNNPLFAQQVGGIYNEDQSILLNGNVVKLKPSRSDTSTNDMAVYDITKLNEKNQIVHEYFRYWNGVLSPITHFQVATEKITVLDPYTLYKDATLNKYFRLVDKQLVEYEYSGSDFSYQIQYTDLVPYVVYLKKYIKKENNKERLVEEYYRYDGIRLYRIDNYSTKIQYGDLELDLHDKNMLYIDELDVIPDNITIGSGVCAEIGFQVKYLTYELEDYCSNVKDYEQCYFDYMQKLTQMRVLSQDEIIQVISSLSEDDEEKTNVTVNILLKFETELKDKIEYFIWDQDTGMFYEITDNRLDFENALEKYLKAMEENNYDQQLIDSKYLIYTMINSKKDQYSLKDIRNAYNALIREETKFLVELNEKLEFQKQGGIVHD